MILVFSKVISAEPCSIIKHLLQSIREKQVTQVYLMAANQSIIVLLVTQCLILLALLKTIEDCNLDQTFKMQGIIFYKIMESTVTLLNLIQRYLIKKTKNKKQQTSNKQV